MDGMIGVLRRFSLIFILLLPSPALAAEIDWQTSVRKGLELAGEEDKPVLLLFHSVTSRDSNHLLRNTLTDESVLAYADQFHWVKVDISVNSAVYRQYTGGSAVPAMVFIDKENRFLGGATGYLEPPQFVRMLEGILEDRETFRQATERIEADPEDVEAHFDLGMILMRRNRFDEGEQRLRKVLELDPENESGKALDIYLTLFHVQVEARKRGEALELAKKILELDPENATGQVDDVHFLKGLMAYRDNDFRAAFPPLRKVVEEYPQSDRIAEAQLLLGTCYINTQQVTQGRKILEQVMNRWPNTPISEKAKELLLQARHMRDRQ